MQLFWRTLKITLLLALASGLLACSDKPDQHAASADVDTSPVVATVNGDPITENDVDFMMERMFSDAELMQADTALRDKVMESLIASRAMQQAALRELEPAQVAEVERRVAAYREELFVQEYLQRHANAQSVTGEMVRDYYEQYPQEFGAQTLRRFELLRAPAQLTDDQQQNLLAAVPRIKAASDWAAQAESWQQQYRLQYQPGSSRPGLLHATLDKALSQLQPGETSDVIYVDGQMHLIRLVALDKVPPQPLSEVSSDIRRKLAPLQLREAVREVSQKARDAAEVVIK